MNISFITISKTKLKNNFKTKYSSQFQNFGRLKNNQGDSFSHSENNSNEKPKTQPLSKEMEQKILEHYKISRYKWGEIKKFCNEHNIQKWQYSDVLDKYGLERENNSARRIITEADIPRIKQMLEEEKTQAAIAKEIGVSSGSLSEALYRLGLKQRGERRIRQDGGGKFEKVSNEPHSRLSNEMIQKILEHSKSANCQYGAIIKFCKDNNISRHQYYKVVSNAKKGIVTTTGSKKFKSVTEEKLMKIEQLLKEGRMQKEIAQIVGVSERYLRSILAEHSYFETWRKENRKPPMSDELKQAILKDYKTSKYQYGAIKKFCDEHHISKRQYGKVITEFGLEHVGNAQRSKVSSEQTERIKQLIQEGKSYEDIIKELNIKYDTLRKVLDKLGIPKVTDINYKLMQDIINSKNAGESPSETCKKLGIEESLYNQYIKYIDMPVIKKQFANFETGQKIKQLRAENKLNREIAEELGVPIYVVASKVQHSSDIPRRISRESVSQNNEEKSQKIKATTLANYEELRKKIKELRTQNPMLSPVEIAEKVNVSESLVRKLITRFPDIPRKNSNVTEETVEKVRKLYKENKSKKEISEETGLSPSKVNYIISNRLPKSEVRNYRITEETVAKVKTFAQQGLTRKQASEKLKISINTLDYITKKYGIKFARKKTEENIIHTGKNDNTKAQKELSSQKTSKPQVSEPEINHKPESQPERVVETPKPVANQNESIKKHKDIPPEVLARIKAENAEILKYAETQKAAINEICSRKSDTKEEIETNKKLLEDIAEDIKNKMLKYPEKTKRHQFLKKLMIATSEKARHLNAKLIILNFNTTPKKILPNKVWLTEDDFKNRVFGYEGLAHIYSLSDEGKQTVCKLNQKIKEAFPDNTVIWIKDYDSFNNGSYPLEKYTVKYRIYKSTDGKRTGHFGTEKTHTMEFVSTWQNAYKNFVEILIEKHKEEK